MRKIVLVLLGIALLAGPLYAKELTTVKGANGVTVKVSLMNDPPVVGENKIKIELTDAEGKAITDAKVRIYYSMRPTGGMTPMNRKAKPKLEGDSYVAALNIGMKGIWDLKLQIRRKNEKNLSVETNIKIN